MTTLRTHQSSAYLSSQTSETSQTREASAASRGARGAGWQASALVGRFDTQAIRLISGDLKLGTGNPEAYP